MANNIVQVKRTTVSGRQPNTTGSYATNSQYIAAGEFALNMADGILYSSNGSAVIEVGANNTNQNITGNLAISTNNKRITFTPLAGGSNVYFIQQNDDNFVFYSTNTINQPRAVFSIYANSITSNVNFVVPVNFSANVGAITSNGSTGTAGQVLTSNGSATYWSTISGSGTVTSVATGNGVTGGPITTTGTISVVANNGITSNTSGLFVTQGTGTVVNATGVHVNSTYIGTIASNSATYANSSVTNTFTVGTASYFVANGNLGIGTSSPGNKLDVASPGSSQIRVKDGVTATAYYDFGRDAVDGLFGFDGAQTTYVGYKWATNGTERMRIDSSGKVGIGNTAPTQKLHVQGSALATADFRAPIFYDSDNTSYYIDGASTSVLNNLNVLTNCRVNDLQWYGAGGGSDQKYWDAYPAGDTGNNLYFRAVNDAYTAAYNWLVVTRSGYQPQQIVFYTGAGLERMRVSSTGGFSVGTTADPGAGAIYATGNITAYYSDKRLKDIISTIPEALTKVNSLSGIIYKNNDIAKKYGFKDKEEQLGVIAQEVQKVVPQAVKAAPFDLDENNQSKSGENYLTVQYEKLIPLLIESIKELSEKVKYLESKIKS